MAKEPTQTYTRSSVSEIQPANRQTPTVRLENNLGKLPKRKGLGDPYKK